MGIVHEGVCVCLCLSFTCPCYLSFSFPSPCIHLTINGLTDVASVPVLTLSSHTLMSLLLSVHITLHTDMVFLY